MKHSEARGHPANEAKLSSLQKQSRNELMQTPRSDPVFSFSKQTYGMVPTVHRLHTSWVGGWMSSIGGQAAGSPVSLGDQSMSGVLLPDPGAPRHEHCPKHRLSRPRARAPLVGKPQVVQQTSLAWSAGGRHGIKEWNDTPQVGARRGSRRQADTRHRWPSLPPGGNGAPTHCRPPHVPGAPSVRGHVLG